MAIITSWIWKAGEDVNGLKIDQENRRLEWFDAVGCACGDSTLTQTFADFVQRGPAFGSLPDDILAELNASLSAMRVTASAR